MHQGRIGVGIPEVDRERLPRRHVELQRVETAVADGDVEVERRRGPGFALGLGVTILALARWLDEPSGDDGVVIGGPIEATAAEGAVVDAEAPQPVSPIRQVTMSARIWTWLHVPRRVCRRPLSRSIVRETSRPASLHCLAGPPGVRLRADG